MVLVPIGESVVDITVDGVSHVAGDVINDDTVYNLSTSYNARIDVNGVQEYYNGAHNQNTTYNVDVSASADPIVITGKTSGNSDGYETVVDSNIQLSSMAGYDRIEARFKGYLDPSSGDFPTGTVVINGSSEASGSNTTVDTGWVTVDGPGRIRITHGSNDSYYVGWTAEIAEYRIWPKTSLSMNGVNES